MAVNTLICYVFSFLRGAFLCKKIIGPLEKQVDLKNYRISIFILLRMLAFKDTEIS